MEPGERSVATLVFAASAAVLVVELVALRLLAPYLGLTLETSTLVIGIALTAIAFGSWWGGRLADRFEPYTLLSPLLAVSGAVVAATPSVVRSTAEWAPLLLMLVAAATILVPGALLSAVTPIVTTMRLTTLEETGTVVGRLSGISTAGSIAGTVLTGFVLISRVPVSWILVGLGLALMIVSVPLAVAARRRAAVLGLVVVGLVTPLAAGTSPGSCDVETQYHCAVIEVDPENPSGRILRLDNLRHSYVDLERPENLEFAYVQAFAALVDSAFPQEDPLLAYHLGGGGLTFPRYLAAARPGTSSVVSEIDPGVVGIDSDQLAPDDDADIDVRAEDGRLGLRRVPADTQDLVVGDAFGGVSVPWHLTTTEAIDEIVRVLDDDGIYVANLIDYGNQGFVRAEVATLRARFDHVAVAGEPWDVGLDPSRSADGGNVIAVASDQEIDVVALQESIDDRELAWSVTTGADLNAWVGDAQVLRDDYAPVDQLLQPFGSSAAARSR